jgi:hypothetical protein
MKLGSWISIILLLASEVAAMSSWFATNASIALIKTHLALSPFHEALLTSSVQAGFVAGTLVSAILTLPDRADLRNMFRLSALVAALATVAIVRQNLGLLIGLLVGALTLGSAMPHLAAIWSGLDWRIPCFAAVSGALVAAGADPLRGAWPQQTARAAVSPVERAAGLAQSPCPPRQFRIFRPHVGALRDVVLDRRKRRGWRAAIAEPFSRDL